MLSVMNLSFNLRISICRFKMMFKETEKEKEGKGVNDFSCKE